MTRSACALLLVLVAAGPVRAQEALAEGGDGADYQALVEQALRESAAGRWEEARALFRRAHAVQPNARTLRGIGMVAFELRDYPDAVRHLSLALADTRRPLTEEQRVQARQLLETAQGFVARYELGNVPAGARVIVDGQPADLEADGTLVLPVGPHHVAVHGERTWEARFTVRGGEHAPLPVSFDAPVLEPAPSVVPISPPRAATRERVVPEAAWVVIASGAAVAVLGAVLLAIGTADVATVENADPGTEWSELAGAYDRAPTLTGIGVTALALGGATAAIGAVWAAIGEERSVGLRVLRDASGTANGVYGSLRLEVW